jgi:hypothetical protein
VDRVLIHAEPVQRAHLWYAAPLANAGGTLSVDFGEAPYSALVRVRLADGLVGKQRIAGNSLLDEEKAKGLSMSVAMPGPSCGRLNPTRC